jgi:hypothetical protein
VREDGRIIGGEKWLEKVYNREKWKKLLRTYTNYVGLGVYRDWKEIEFPKEYCI